MPMVMPSNPTTLRHRGVRPASIETRRTFFTEYGFLLRSRQARERLQAWSAHHARALAALCQNLLRLHGQTDLAAGGDQHQLGIVHVREHVGPAQQLLRVEASGRVSVGSFWRDSTSAVGPWRRVAA